MGKSITFLHASDLHIGAPFRGVREVSPEWGERLLAASTQAYARVVDAAIEYAVDFVVIAGDVFDQAQPSYADQMRFLEGLIRLNEANIPVYCVPGNHDPFISWESFYTRFPDNVCVFSGKNPGYALYERAGEPLCLVMGRGFHTKKFPDDECIADRLYRSDAVSQLGVHASRAPFAVGILHTGLDVESKKGMKAPVSRKRLLSTDIDYWALGHLHARQCIPADNPRICFSGATQGRDITETGPHGVNLVTLEEGVSNKVEFIPTASVVWQQLELDISACETLPEIEDKVRAALTDLFIESFCQDVYARIALSGSSALRGLLQQPDVIQGLRADINLFDEHFYCDALINETWSPHDLDAIYDGALFPAEVVDVCDGMQEDLQGVVDYLQDEFMARGLRMPPALEQDTEHLVDEARSLVLDLLVRGDAR